MIPHAWCEHCFRRVPADTLKWVRTPRGFVMWCASCANPDLDAAEDTARRKDWA